MAGAPTDVNAFAAVSGLNSKVKELPIQEDEGSLQRRVEEEHKQRQKAKEDSQQQRQKEKEDLAIQKKHDRQYTSEECRKIRRHVL